MEAIRFLLIAFAAVSVIVCFLLGARLFLEMLADEDEAEFWATPRPESTALTCEFEFDEHVTLTFPHERIRVLSAASMGRETRR